MYKPLPDGLTIAKSNVQGLGLFATKDFDALGMLAKETNNLFNLPTESYKQNSKYWQIISPEYTEGIFDAAAIGSSGVFT